MIQLQGIEKTYGAGAGATPVLRGIDLTVESGEYVAIMGRSGTGKSTLMNIIGALDRPTKGSYRLGGEDVFALDDDALSGLRNRKIGFVFQQFHLMDRASSLANVLLPFVYREGDAADAEALAARALEAVGLADRKHHRPGELSGGQQQRVAIARALVTDPSLILADEPTGNLDAQSGAEILALFDALNAQGRTIVLITHDKAVAEHARRVVVLEEGRVVEDRRAAPRAPAAASVAP